MFNIKVLWMGGLSVVCVVYDIVVDVGIFVWCGGMYEFGVGRVVNVVIFLLFGFLLFLDVFGLDKYYIVDIVDLLVCVEVGCVVVLSGFGIGYEVFVECIECEVFCFFDIVVVDVCDVVFVCG